MSETQVLMAVSRNHFLEGDLTFQYETSFLSGKGCPSVPGFFQGGEGGGGVSQRSYHGMEV